MIYRTTSATAGGGGGVGRGPLCCANELRKRRRLLRLPREPSAAISSRNLGGCCLRVPSNRLGVQAQGHSDAVGAHASVEQGVDITVPLTDLPLVGCFLTGLLRIEADAIGLQIRGFEAEAAPGDGLLQRGGEIVEQMPPVGDLRDSGLSSLGAFGERAPAVTADGADARLLVEPVGEGVGRVVGQHVDGAMGIHVDQDGAVAPATAERELVDPQHRRLGQLR